MALAYAVAKQINKKNTTIKSVGNITGSNTTSVSMTYNNKPATSSWIIEQGQWRMSKMSFVKLTEIVENGIITKFAHHKAIVYTRNNSLGGDIPIRFNTLSYEEYISYLTYSYGIGIGKWGEKLFNSVEIALGGTLPIAIENFRIFPHIKPFTGISFEKKDAMFNFGVKSGVDIAYKLGRKFHILAGVGYELRAYNMFSGGNYWANNIAFRLGVMF